MELRPVEDTSWLQLFIKNTAPVSYTHLDVYKRQTLETVLDHADYPQARRLEIVKNIIAGYANVFICLDDGQGNIL